MEKKTGQPLVSDYKRRKKQTNKKLKSFDRLASGIRPSGPFPKMEKECKKNQDKNIKKKERKKTF